MSKERISDQLNFFTEVRVEPQPPRPTRAEKKAIENLVGVFSWPVVVWPGYEDIIREDLRQDITTARLIQQMKAHQDGNIEALDYATDVEAMAYVSTASLAHPLDHDWYMIYMNLFCDWLEGKGREVPADIAEDRRPLNDLQREDLARLKRWIRTKQRQAVKGR